MSTRLSSRKGTRPTLGGRCTTFVSRALRSTRALVCLSHYGANAPSRGEGRARPGPAARSKVWFAGPLEMAMPEDWVVNALATRGRS